MHLDRLARDEQLLGDLAVGAPLDGEVRDAALARGQRRGSAEALAPGPCAGGAQLVPRPVAEPGRAGAVGEVDRGPQRLARRGSASRLGAGRRPARRAPPAAPSGTPIAAPRRPPPRAGRSPGRDRPGTPRAPTSAALVAAGAPKARAMRTSFSARLRASPRSPVARSARTASGGQCGASSARVPSSPTRRSPSSDSSRSASPGSPSARCRRARDACRNRNDDDSPRSAPGRPSPPPARRRPPRDRAGSRTGPPADTGSVSDIGISASRRSARLTSASASSSLPRCLRAKALPVSDVASARVRCPSLDRAIASSW